MTHKYQEIPNWKFSVNEVSANVFNVVGRDVDGHMFEKTGIDADSMLNEAKQYALKFIDEQRPTRK